MQLYSPHLSKKIGELDDRKSGEQIADQLEPATHRGYLAYPRPCSHHIGKDMIQSGGRRRPVKPSSTEVWTFVSRRRRVMHGHFGHGTVTALQRHHVPLGKSN